MSALSTIHAPELGRHGWIQQVPGVHGGTRGPAPADCPAVATHSSWESGFRFAQDTPPGHCYSVLLSRRVCDHDWDATCKARGRRRPPPVDPQGVLF